MACLAVGREGEEKWFLRCALHSRGGKMSSAQLVCGACAVLLLLLLVMSRL
jgi:xanthine dehydrogenase iron-sulfur cluster and FAD-binding subunit A